MQPIQVFISAELGRFFAFPGRLSEPFFPLFSDLFACAMVLVCARTCVVHATSADTVFPRPEVLAMLEKEVDFEKLSAVQLVRRGLIRLTFKDPDDKESLVERGMLNIRELKQEDF